MIDLVAVDVGTSSIRAVRYDDAGAVRAQARREVAVLEPRPFRTEQDPLAIASAFDEVVREVASRSPSPRALSLSAHLHSLLALDAEGAPLGAVQLWSDGRAASEAAAVRRAGLGAALHERTGCPPHSSYPRERLAWMRAHEPRRFASASRFVSIKAWLLARITGRLVEDEVTASATGLLDLRRRRYDAEALSLAGVGEERLGEIVHADAVAGEMLPAVCRSLGLAPGSPVVVGGGDGMLAMLGSGADAPGVLSITVGTSAAVRVAAAEPPRPATPSLWCTILDRARYARGAASNNGGAALDWAWRRFAPGFLTRRALEGALDVRLERPLQPGLLVLPFIFGERSPAYEAGYSLAVSGADETTDKLDLLAAFWRGVAHHLLLLFEEVERACGTPERLLASGAAFRSPLFARMIADALGREIEVPEDLEASARGAWMVGLKALGETPPANATGSSLALSVPPHPGRTAAYRADLARHREAMDRMRPVWRRLVDPSP